MITINHQNKYYRFLAGFRVSQRDGKFLGWSWLSNSAAPPLSLPVEKKLRHYPSDGENAKQQKECQVKRWCQQLSKTTFTSFKGDHLLFLFRVFLESKKKRFRSISDSLRSTSVSTTICCSTLRFYFLGAKRKREKKKRLSLPVDKFQPSCVLFVFSRYFSRL